jgi:hypothetical protein
MPDVADPIFIVGTGRCGSTLFHHMLSFHEHVSWLSPSCQKRPARPQLNRRYMSLLDAPLFSRYARKLIYPVEAYAFWERYCPGFSEPCRDLTEHDLAPKAAKKVRRALAQVITDRRPRLLVKVTGWPRIRYLKALYPDARFIHVYRDGRAVANSLLNIYFWSGWRGPDNWRWGALSPEQQARWVEHDRSFAALAGIQWEILMEAQEQARQFLSPDDLLEIRYENLCRDVTGIFENATQFCSLDWSTRFKATVQTKQIVNTNDKWRQDLGSVQQQQLNTCIQHALAKYGYA